MKDLGKGQNGAMAWVYLAFRFIQTPGAPPQCQASRGGQNDNLLPSTYTSALTQQVDDIAFVYKKGRIERSMLITFNL
jgi:hypothetical protein